MADAPVDSGFRVWDVPVNPKDPNCSTFTSRRIFRTEDNSDVYKPKKS